jgi:purine catabolism regulator
MTTTVRDVLALEIFTRADPRVLSGEDRLDREVRWVHTGEIPDIARFLSGGEMLLTAGLGFGQSAREQRAYVRSLADADIAVLVVELAGRAFTHLPAAALAEARERRLPIVGLGSEIPFVAVSAQVDRMITGARLEQLEASERTAEQFQQLLLNGADHIAILDHLSMTTHAAVVLEDAAHQIRGWAGREVTGAQEVVDNWEAHSRISHGTGAPAESALRCRADEVVLRGERWGRLHVLHAAGRLSAADNQAISQAVAAAAITFLSERASRASFALRSTALVNRLALGEIDGAELVRRSRSLGVGLDARRLLAIASYPDPANSIGSGLMARRFPYLSAELGSYTQWIVSLRRDADEVAVIDVVTKSGVRAGLSRPLGASALRHGLRQSKQALDASSAEGPARVQRFDQLGVARLLVTLSRDELATYVEDELGALLDHDAKTKSVLLPTLRAFLEVSGTRSAAAGQLRVQRRSLYYRLERIEKILGLDLGEPDVRSRLHLAVKALDMLRPADAATP